MGSKLTPPLCGSPSQSVCFHGISSLTGKIRLKDKFGIIKCDRRSVIGKAFPLMAFFFRLRRLQNIGDDILVLIVV